MKCPNCQNRDFNVYEARGFTAKESPIKECDCGHVWRVIPLGEGKRRIDIIREGKVRWAMTFDTERPIRFGNGFPKQGVCRTRLDEGNHWEKLPGLTTGSARRSRI
jgi:hypothetical protein